MNKKHNYTYRNSTTMINYSYKGMDNKYNYTYNCSNF